MLRQLRCQGGHERVVHAPGDARHFFAVQERGFYGGAPGTSAQKMHPAAQLPARVMASAVVWMHRLTEDCNSDIVTLLPSGD